MEQPKITWLVRTADEEDFRKSPEFYAGTYNQEEDLSIYIQLWNNRYGTEAVKPLSDFGISVTFDKEEDSVFLKYMTFHYGVAEFTPVVSGNTGVIQLPDTVELSGALNDGSDENTDNYIVLRLDISVPWNVSLKMNDLKTMTLGITKL